MKLKCIFFLILLLATICQCDEHDHIVSKFEFFTFVVKGWVISKGISNLVPSSKIPRQIYAPQLFTFGGNDEEQLFGFGFFEDF